MIFPVPYYISLLTSLPFLLSSKKICNELRPLQLPACQSFPIKEILIGTLHLLNPENIPRIYLPYSEGFQITHDTELANLKRGKMHRDGLSLKMGNTAE